MVDQEQGVVAGPLGEGWCSFVISFLLPGFDLPDTIGDMTDTILP
jgi:hypothetical protein